ncbi:MAG: integrase core domain-containing protein [Bacteroidales bacterium]|nr:integrase core domain-containing protein [Bacteroidales bacterium]
MIIGFTPSKPNELWVSDITYWKIQDKVVFLHLIHHSDRGSQYCANLYVNMLKKRNIQISMTQNGDPLENAIAERVNGIIKDEYLLNYQCDNIQEAKIKLNLAVSLYNNERPHSSIGNLTPEYVHSQYPQISDEKIKKLWKNYYTKKTILKMDAKKTFR